jgi:hypothetical protein
MLSYYLRNKERIKLYQSEYYKTLDYTTRRNKIINYEQANKDYIMAKRKHYYNTIKMKIRKQKPNALRLLMQHDNPPNLL